jgi:hypothetical protein
MPKTEDPMKTGGKTIQGQLETADEIATNPPHVGGKNPYAMAVEPAPPQPKAPDKA